MNGATIRVKRTTAGLSGALVCMKANICRTRLCGIERGQLAAGPQELLRISAAIDDLTEAQRKIRATAAAAGWPVPFNAVSLAMPEGSSAGAIAVLA